jgi:hypothetical protein
MSILIVGIVFIPPFIANLCQDEQDKKDLNNFIKDLLNAEKKAVLEKIRN